MRSKRVIIAMLAAAFFPSLAWAGNIAGKVKVTGLKDSREVVVSLETPKGMTIPPPKEEVTMDQKGLTFIPHILPIQAGTVVNFLNSDPERHSIFTPSPIGDKFNLGTYGKGESRKKTFTKVGEVVCLCNVHAEMSAYILVMPNPYFAVTDAEGNFKIPQVPAGKYTMKTWHEKIRKPVLQEVSVPADGEVKVDLELKK